MVKILNFFILLSVVIFSFGCSPTYQNSVAHVKVNVKGKNKDLYYISTTVLQMSKQDTKTLGTNKGPILKSIQATALYGKKLGYKYMAIGYPHQYSQIKLLYNKKNEVEFLFYIRTHEDYFPYYYQHVNYIDENGDERDTFKHINMIVKYFHERPIEYFSFSIDKILQYFKDENVSIPILVTGFNVCDNDDTPCFQNQQYNFKNLNNYFAP